MAPLQLALFPICMKVWTLQGKKATQEFLSRSLDQFALVAIGVVAVAMVTSRDLVVLLASKKFAQSHELLPYLVMGIVFSAVTIYFRPGLAHSQKRIQDCHGHAGRKHSQCRVEPVAAATDRAGGRGHCHHHQLWRHRYVSGLPVTERVALQN